MSIDRVSACVYAYKQRCGSFLISTFYNIYTYRCRINLQTIIDILKRLEYRYML